MRDPAVTIRRILKVNHAGESGAVRIYGAQIAVARLFYPDIVPALKQMRRDEIDHRRLFREAMPTRRTMPCRVMRLWTLGGFVLGFVTALLGRNMIWICTEAVEATVHRHLRQQLAYLERRDPELFALIAAIEEEELAHLRSAEAHQTRRNGWFRAAAFGAIGLVTATMIWLSTWGDPTPMQREVARS
jgi:ubiquinone biosynthesis monooxygenase Coq7